MNEHIDSPISRNPDIISADMKGETIMMSISTGNYHAVSAVGARIWELLETPKHPEALIEMLVEEYDVSPETCSTEVTTFLKQMLKEKVILIKE